MIKIWIEVLQRAAACKGEERGDHIITSNKRRAIVDLMPTVRCINILYIALAHRNVLFLLSFKSSRAISSMVQ